MEAGGRAGATTTGRSCPTVLRKYYDLVITKLANFQRGQDTIALGDEHKRVVAANISAKTDFLVQLSPMFKHMSDEENCHIMQIHLTR